MTKILIIHLGSIAECFIASSINHDLFKKYGNSIQITWVVKDDIIRNIFQYNKKIFSITMANFVLSLPKSTIPRQYDILINLDANFNGINNDLLNIDSPEVTPEIKQQLNEILLKAEAYLNPAKSKIIEYISEPKMKEYSDQFEKILQQLESVEQN